MKPPRTVVPLWAIKTPHGALLTWTASRHQTIAWALFRGYLGLQSRQAAKKQGCRPVRVVIHEAGHPCPSVKSVVKKNSA